ncbi:AP-3 complex subunit delta-1-like [Lycorma delicatula]|uniref:AP-3 complex subunit delta-1-like n=1 Tax=Lycorma delicatula TaxID=130591 RepID=UPI003F5148EE
MAALFSGELNPVAPKAQRKLREARKLEQAMNPHYLKTNNDITSDIPVAEIESVPLKIQGLNSDKYLRKSSKKNKRKKKKKGGIEVDKETSSALKNLKTNYLFK